MNTVLHLHVGLLTLLRVTHQPPGTSTPPFICQLILVPRTFPRAQGQKTITFPGAYSRERAWRIALEGTMLRLQGHTNITWTAEGWLKLPKQAFKKVHGGWSQAMQGLTSEQIADDLVAIDDFIEKELSSRLIDTTPEAIGCDPTRLAIVEPPRPQPDEEERDDDYGVPPGLGGPWDD